MLAKAETSINLEGYVGHINLRASVMGKAAWERVATPEECRQMAALLDDGTVALILDLVNLSGA